MNVRLTMKGECGQFFQESVIFFVGKGVSVRDSMGKPYGLHLWLRMIVRQKASRGDEILFAEE